MNHKERIVCDPNVMLGKPIIKNTRITVEVVLRKLSSGYTLDEITTMYQNNLNIIDEVQKTRNN